MTAAKEVSTSIHWNGVTYTASASDGSKFGTATGDTEDEAVKAAVANLSKSPESTPPEQSGSGTEPTGGKAR